MNRATTWLVGTEEDRRRIRDNDAVVTRARKITTVAVIATLPFLVGRYGLWILLVGGLYAAYARFVDHKYATSPYGDVWMISLTLTTQAMFAWCTIVTGGPRSPAMLWLVICMVLLPCRYGRNGIVIGSIFSLGCLFAAALSHGWSALVDYPEMFLVTLSTGIACLTYGSALRTGEVTQRRAAVVDPLTGLLNRAKLDERFEEVRQIAVARGRTVGLMFCDLDHFKAVNDEYGHAAGDRVLVDTAEELRRVLDGHELIYRLGGEEFAVVLEDTDLPAATALGERVRAATFAAQPGGIQVTISVGVAVASAGEIDFGELYTAADAALYRAKHAGRNRVVAGRRGDEHVRAAGASPVPPGRVDRAEGAVAGACTP